MICTVALPLPSRFPTPAVPSAPSRVYRQSGSDRLAGGPF